MSMLTDVLPAAVRKVVYTVYALIVFVLGAMQVGFSSAGQGQPAWVTVALSVAAFVGAGLGFTAAANISTPSLTPLEREADAQAAGNDLAGFPYVP